MPRVTGGHGDAGAGVTAARPLRYGSLVNFYKQSLDGYVVATFSAEAPVGVQRDTDDHPLRYEQTVFLLQRGDPIDLSEGSASLRNDMVKYGQNIRLLHYAHQQPLSYHTERHAVGMKGNLRVLLEKRGKGTLKVERWRIMPRYRLRVEGEPVADGDPVVLQAADGERYLNVVPDVTAGTADSSVDEVSVGESFQGFTMCLYDGDMAPPQMSVPPLRCGDCVTLLHAEEHKYMIADLVKRQCVLRTPDSRMLEDGDSTAESREHTVAWYAASKEEVSFLSLFVIEGADARRGGALRTRGANDLYRLKSLASGLYLQCGAVLATNHVPAGNVGGPHEGGLLLPSDRSLEFPAAHHEVGGRGGDATRTSTRREVGSSVLQAPYLVSLTPNVSDTGTLFQLHAASSHEDEYLGNGGRVFLSCVNGKSRRIWVVAGGPVHAQNEAGDSEVTVASLANRVRTYGTVQLLGKRLKSMRDGLEVQRLQPLALEELYVIRGLLPPLEQYVHEMATGAGTPHQVRQVRENVRQLQQLCYRNTESDTEDSVRGVLPFLHGDSGALNPEWQSKVFQQGVGELALQVVKATFDCPYMQADKLGSLEMVHPQMAARVGISGDTNGSAAHQRSPLPSLTAEVEKTVPSSSTTVRYSELGDLVAMCFQLVRLLLYNRPRYAEELQEYADFVMRCAPFVPSALQCLAALYKDNAALVELPMARYRLDFFLEMLVGHGRNPDVVYILQLFASCNGDGMVEAQRVILEHFSKNRELAQQVFCPIRRQPLSSELSKVLLEQADVQPPRSSRERKTKPHGPSNEEEKALDDFQGSSCRRPRYTNPLSMSGGQDAAETPAKDVDTTTGASIPSAAAGAMALSPSSPAKPRAEKGREAVMLGIPHSLFGDRDADDTVSVATSTQYRAHSNALGGLLQMAADAEDGTGTTFFPLEGLLDVMRDWPEIKDTLVPYLVAQLHLFAALTFGKGTVQGRAFVFEWVPRDVLVETIQSGLLPRPLHGAFLELFTNVMTELDGALDLREQIRNIRCVVSRSDDGDGDGRGTGVLSSYPLSMRKVPDELSAAKLLVVQYLETTPMSGDDNIVAEYLSMLHLADALVNIGVFVLTEYESLMRLLVRCVDPSCADHSTNLEVQLVYDCKARALRLINMLMDVLLVREALQLVDFFREGKRPVWFSQLAHLSFEASHHARVTVDWIESDQAKDPPEELDLTRDYNLDGVYLKEERKPAEELAPVAEMFTALLELANRSRSSILQRQVVCLFFRATNFIEELHVTANQVQLLSSAESIGFYSALNRTSLALEQLLLKSFRRSNTIALANGVLDALDGFLSALNCGSMTDKLSMMQHAGVPLQLIRMLERVNVPLRDASRHIVFKTVLLLQTMSSNSTVRGELREAVVDASPLVYHNTNYISLLRTLYIDEGNEQLTMPALLLTDVVKCFSTEHSAATAVEFLCDWLTAPSLSLHVRAQRQQQVWRSIISDRQAERQVQLRHSWCGNAGQQMREELLMSDDVYSPTGRVCTHLELCRLLYLIADKNEFVQAEEVRQEVFGENSFDTLLQVTTDVMVPLYFRYPYVRLLQALVLDDAEAIPSLFAHRDLTDFLHVCRMDAARYFQLLGGSFPFPEASEELERREEGVFRCLARNEAEQELDEVRYGISAYEEFFFGPLCTCVALICTHYRLGVTQLSNRARSQLGMMVHELVDSLCDVAQLGLEHHSGSKGGGSSRVSVPAELHTRVAESYRHTSASSAEGKDWGRKEWGALRRCLRIAKESGFSGTARWRGDPFSSMYARLEEVEEGAAMMSDASSAAAATVTSRNTSSITTGSTRLKDGNHRSGMGEAESDEGTHMLTMRWSRYLRSVLMEDARVAEEHQLCSAAGILLRSGARVTIFLRIFFTLMPSLPRRYLLLTLKLIRQVVMLMPNNPYDDSALLPLVTQESDVPYISVRTPVPARQSLLARWVGDASLDVPLPLIALVAEFVGYGKADVRRAALLAACTLLMKGHRGMQECYRSFCRHSPNEQLFLTLRNHFAAFKDELRTYSYALAGGSTPLGAAHHLTQMSNCQLELRMLQLLCAGQYTPLQEYLAAQPDNSVSVNVIEALVELLAMAPWTANEVTSGFMLQLLSTAAESLQGPCVMNQDMFVVYDAANFLTLLLSDHDILPHPKAVATAVEVVLPCLSWREAHFDRLLEKVSPATILEKRRRRCRNLLQTSALSTLLALIEGRDDSNFASRLISTVDLSVLARSMDRSAAAYEARHGPIERMQSRGLLQGDYEGCVAALRQYLREYIHSDHPSGAEELEDELALAVSIYTFFRAVHDMHALAMVRSRRDAGGANTLGDAASHDLDEFVDRKGQSVRQALRKTKYHRAVATRLAKIEVVRDGRLERVYFRVLNAAKDNLSRYRRHYLITTTARTSDNERIQSFFNQTSEVIVEINWYARMRRFLLLHLINVFGGEICIIGLLVVVAINVVMVAATRAPTSPFTDAYTTGEVDVVLRGLGIANIILQGILVVQSFIGPAMVSYRIGWQSWRAQRERALVKHADADITLDRGETLLRGKQAVRRHATVLVAKSLYFICTDSLFLPQAFFFVVSVMGFVEHRIWYSLQMAQVFLRLPALESLFRALLQNTSALVQTFALLLIIVLFFANISFYEFSELFNPLGSNGNGFNCYTLSQCWLVHVDTLRSSGGIGDVLSWPAFYSANGYGYWSEFFRMAHFVLVNLIGLNLFLGVIIESLAQYRLDQAFVKTDQENKCFMCGIERNKFDVAQSGAYDKHIREEHNMWQYIFFLHYLSEKNSDLYTGQEAYVRRQVSVRDVTFYPIGRSLVLDAMEGGGASAGRVADVPAPSDNEAGQDDGDRGRGNVAEDGSSGEEALLWALTAKMEATLKMSLDPLRQTLEAVVAALQERPQASPADLHGDAATASAAAQSSTHEDEQV